DAMPNVEEGVHQGPSWVPAFPIETMPQILLLERDIVQGDFRAAILRCDGLCAEVLADAAELHGLDADERKPLLVAMCLGLSGLRFRVPRALGRGARGGAAVGDLEARGAWAVLLELNRPRKRADRR